MSHSRRVALLALLIGGWISYASTALAASGTKLVRYHGYGLRVPASWPVFELSRRPTTCVRFNRHAVYLGVPSRSQRCPAHSVGRTESILIAPVSAAAAGAGSGAIPLTGSVTVLRRRGLTIAATWGRDPASIEHALRLAGVPRASAAVPTRAAGAAAASTAAATPRAQAAGGVFTGRGFDACTAPSPAVMSAWASSPYHAVGIYLGGANMGCSQPNLTADWVRAQSAAGWHLIPTYVGLQASTTSCPCATITPSKAASQGTAAAADAVAHAQLLGIGKGNPIYFDMEAYDRSGSAAVLTFLAAWTAGLHAAGYLSGVYSSANSGIADLVAAYGTGYVEPDELWIARWNGAYSVADPSVPSTEWSNHQRVHQYAGGVNVTYGGDTINIDGDYLDGASASAGTSTSLALFADGTLIQASGQPYVYEIAGGAPLYLSDWSVVGGLQPLTTATPQQFASLPSVPLDGTMLQTSSTQPTPSGPQTTTQLYRVAGGAAFPVTDATVLGVTPVPVTIDPWDIVNAGTPLAHVQSRPSAGAVVEGMPSGTYWIFQTGGRRQLTLTPGAVTVNDSALAPYPVLAASSGVPSPPVVRCVVPVLRRRTIPQARTALSRAHCRLGTIHGPRVRPRHTLRVVAQSAKAASRHAKAFRVSITVR